MSTTITIAPVLVGNEGFVKSMGRNPKDSSHRSLSELQLLHLADSALPIGSLAHSFGLETLISSGLVNVDDLGGLFEVYLREAGLVEGVYCRAAWGLGDGIKTFSAAKWLELNEKLNARKMSRESRSGSGSLGLHFMTAVLGLGEFPPLPQAFAESQRVNGTIHHSTAFGLAGAALNFPVGSVVAAYLHQSLAGLVSACQRLLPFGQREATRLLWNLKPTMLKTVEQSETNSIDDVSSFTPLLDWGAMEHPSLTTR